MQTILRSPDGLDGPDSLGIPLVPVVLRRNDGTEGMLLTDPRPLPDLSKSECSAGPAPTYRIRQAPRVPRRERVNHAPLIGILLAFGVPIVGVLALWLWRSW